MTLGWYYVLDGRNPKRVSLFEWAPWFENFDNRRIGRTTVGNIEVSTVFLGLDHGFGGGPPVLFETMIFGGRLNGQCHRYTSYDEAEAGHAATVAQVERTHS